MAKSDLYPYLTVRNADAAIAFYGNAFGAVEKYRLRDAAGRIGQAEIDVGGRRLMLADEFPEYGVYSPLALGASTVAIHLEVADTDAAVKQAVEAGAALLIPPADTFTGERAATLVDPFGYRWQLAHRVEKLTPEEMQRRYDEMVEKARQDAERAAAEAADAAREAEGEA